MTTTATTADPIAEAHRHGPILGRRLAALLPELQAILDQRSNLVGALIDHFDRVDDPHTIPGWPATSLDLLEAGFDAVASLCETWDALDADKVAGVQRMLNDAGGPLEPTLAEVRAAHAAEVVALRRQVAALEKAEADQDQALRFVAAALVAAAPEVVQGVTLKATA